MIRVVGGNPILPALVVAFVLAVVTSVIAIFSVGLASDIWNKFIEAFALVVGGGVAVTIVFSVAIGGRRR